MQNASDIIDALGGTSKVAGALGIPPQTVSSWKATGSIPKWRTDAVRKLAKSKGVDLAQAQAL